MVKLDMIQTERVDHRMNGSKFRVSEARLPIFRPASRSEQKLLPTSMPTESALMTDDAGVLFLVIGREVGFRAMSKVEASLHQSLSCLA